MTLMELTKSRKAYIAEMIWGFCGDNNFWVFNPPRWPVAGICEPDVLPVEHRGLQVKPVLLVGAGPSLFWVDFDGNAEGELHTHGGGRVITVVSGTGVFEVWAGGGRRTIPLRRDDQVVFGPGVPHTSRGNMVCLVLQNPYIPEDDPWAWKQWPSP